VAGLDERIAGKAGRWQREAVLLTSVPGFGDVVAQAWRGQIGAALHLHFATCQKLASRVTLCPGNNISARKRKHGRTGDAGTYIKPMLVQAAWNAIGVRGRLQAPGQPTPSPSLAAAQAKVRCRAPTGTRFSCQSRMGAHLSEICAVCIWGAGEGHDRAWPWRPTPRTSRVS
jgi:hypothetical protein